MTQSSNSGTTSGPIGSTGGTAKTVHITVPPPQVSTIWTSTTGTSPWPSGITQPSGKLHIVGENPTIELDNGDEINLREVYDLLKMIKTLNEHQMSLPLPDAGKLKKYEVLRVQWQELMDLAKQYKITEALLDEKDNK